MMAYVSELEAYIAASDGIADNREKAEYCHDKVFATMQKVRAAADAMEGLCDSSYWPFPTYGDLLFSVK